MTYRHAWPLWFAALLVGVGAVVFVRVELEAMARRAWQRIRWGRVMGCGR